VAEPPPIAALLDQIAVRVAASAGWSDRDGSHTRSVERWIVLTAHALGCIEVVGQSVA
jgi:predicted alpha/beta hydrolase family esterase